MKRLKIMNSGLFILEENMKFCKAIKLMKQGNKELTKLWDHEND